MRPDRRNWKPRAPTCDAPHNAWPNSREEPTRSAPRYGSTASSQAGRDWACCWRATTTKACASPASRRTAARPGPDSRPAIAWCAWATPPSRATAPTRAWRMRAHCWPTSASIRPCGSPTSAMAGRTRPASRPRRYRRASPSTGRDRAVPSSSAAKTACPGSKACRCRWIRSRTSSRRRSSANSANSAGWATASARIAIFRRWRRPSAGAISTWRRSMPRWAATSAPMPACSSCPSARNSKACSRAT